MKNILTLLLFSLFSISSFSQDYVGNWVGELTIATGKLAIAFTIEKSGDNYLSTMDIPNQGLMDAKAETTILKDTVLTITFPNFGLEYKGSLTNKNKIVGKLYQGGLPIELNLNRGEIVLNRPQEPKPPFSYYSEELTFNTSDNFKLAGTLSLPKKEGKFPVVVIISGSGPQNRDGEVFGHKTYFVIADYLTNNGIGVLRFDERGVGQSEGEFDTANIDIFASDVNSALDYLKTRKDVNTDKIGLLGHSIGGIVAPKVASENKAVSFIVLLAAPGVNGDKLMLSQKAALERKLGLNEMQLAQSLDVVKGPYDIIVNSGLDNASLKDSINTHYFNKYGKQLPENQRNALVNQLTGYEMVSLIQSKPSIYLSKVKCPVLSLGGTNDLQVLSKENLEAIEKALKESGNTNVETIEFENLNHLFQESKTGMKNEYSEIEQTIAPKVLELIANWIAKQTN